MPKDAPDFSVGTLGLSPIAINTIPLLKNYPGGSVFFFDNFEGPNITWEIKKQQGADYCFAEIDKTQAYLGAGCARLYRNEDQRIYIKLRRQFQFRSSDTIGIEFSFMISDKSNAKAEIIYRYRIGSTNYMFYIIFEEGRIIVYTSWGPYAYSYGPGNGLKNMVWSNVKVIINTKDHRYVRLYYGKKVYNISYSAYTYSGEGDESPRLRLCFYSNYGGSAAKSLWIDKVILTDDETI